MQYNPNLTMLLVKTKLGRSKIQGMGLFADEFIPKGTLVQKFIDGVDLELTPEVVDILPGPAKKNFLHYAYRNKITNKYILNSDDARFLNSSVTPNLIGDELNKEADIAARDIERGEELTVDYSDFDDLAQEKLKQHKPHRKILWGNGGEGNVF